MLKKNLILLFLLSTLVLAHSGRTDSNGGHHTKNCNHAAGICHYHYH